MSMLIDYGSSLLEFCSVFIFLGFDHGFSPICDKVFVSVMRFPFKNFNPGFGSNTSFLFFSPTFMVCFPA